MSGSEAPKTTNEQPAGTESGPNPPASPAAVGAPGESKPRHRLHTKLVLIVIICLLVIAGIGYGTYRLTRGTHNAHTQSVGAKQQAAAIPQLSGTALLSKMDDYTVNGKYADAIRLLQGQKPQTQQSQSLIAMVYMMQKQYPQALNSYDSMKSRYGLQSFSPWDAASAGQAAEQAGQYQLAITYYQRAEQAVSAIKVGNIEQNNQMAAQYQAKIAELQKKL